MAGGAPKGNTNGAKQNRLFSDAIKRHLTQNPDQLRRIVDKMFKALEEEPDPQLFRELADRADGKPKQQLELSQDPDNPVTKIDRSMPAHDAAMIYSDTIKQPPACPTSSTH